MRKIQTQLHIAHNSAELDVDGALIVSRDIEEGFLYSTPTIFLKTQEFKEYLEELDMLDLGKSTKYDFSSGSNVIFVKYFSENYKLYARGNSKELSIMFACKTEALALQIWRMSRKYMVDDGNVEIYYTSYYINGAQLGQNEKTFNIKDLAYISRSYYPYIDIDLMFDQFFTGAENILLVVGKPGLGKSKLSTMALKYAYENTDKLPYDKFEENPGIDYQYINVVTVKSIDVLSTDMFWRNLEASTPDFVIIDDLDYMLTKRDSEVTSSEDIAKNKFLNQFLSFTDGFEKHKTKFIITTNQTYDNIDTALLRKGRLFDILELRQLDPNEAQVIWEENNLNAYEYKKIFGDGKITAAELGSEINKRLNTRIDDAVKSYIKEPGISKIQKANRTKRIGM